MREWQFGNRYEGFVKLDQLAAFFGTRRKNGDGADFHKKFFGTPEERVEALEYLNNDVMMTVEIAAKMGLIAKPAIQTAAQSESQPEPSPPTQDTAPTVAKQDDIY
jgi:putative salt-induced outer membrane protein YdiY